MNVGGHRLTNDELRRHVESLGFEVSFLYRASGNVVLRSELESEAVQESIEQGLEGLLGYAVPTVVRDTDDLRQLVRDQPFSSGKPQVVFRRNSSPADVGGLVTPVDEFSAHHVDVFWLPMEGISGTQVDPKAFEKVLGINTVRTVGTIEGILKKIVSVS